MAADLRKNFYLGQEVETVMFPVSRTIKNPFAGEKGLYSILS
jgi:hypothetical protein